MRDPFKAFLKAEIARQKEISTGCVFLDRVFKIPYQSFLLIQGEAYSGTTALCLEVVAALTQKHKLVVFVDLFNSIYNHRLLGVDKDYLIFYRPWEASPKLFLETADSICREFPQAVFILDNSYLLERNWERGSWNLTEIVKQLRQRNPQATVIATQRSKYISDIWSYVVYVKKEKSRYEFYKGNFYLSGHIAKIRGPEGHSRVFIDYYTGRVSKAYEHAMLEIENGKSKSSSFTYDGITCKGIWSLVHEVGRKQKNELQNR